VIYRDTESLSSERGIRIRRGGEKGDDPKGKGESYEDHAASPTDGPGHMRKQQEQLVEKEFGRNSQQRREYIPAGRLEEPKQKAPATPAAPKQTWAARVAAKPKEDDFTEVGKNGN